MTGGYTKMCTGIDNFLPKVVVPITNLKLQGAIKNLDPKYQIYYRIVVGNVIWGMYKGIDLHSKFCVTGGSKHNDIQVPILKQFRGKMLLKS